MPTIAQSFKNTFPITAKLSPINKANLPYLLQTAILTRLAVGAARISENSPKRNQTSEMTPEEKKKAFAERCFVEIVGTLGYILLLHLGQDFASHILEHINKPFIPTIREKAIQEIMQKKSDIPLKQFENAFDEVIGTKTKGLVGRIVNLRKVPWSKDLAGSNLRSLAIKLDLPFEEFMRRAPKVLSKEYPYKANKMFNIAIVFSVFFSAIIGGYGTQWVNDTFINRYLKKRYPEKVPEGFLSLASSESNPFAQTGDRRAK